MKWRFTPTAPRRAGVSDYGGVGKQLTAVLNQVKSYSGANNGPPVTSGPLGPQGPIINGIPVDTPMTPGEHAAPASRTC